MNIALLGYGKEGKSLEAYFKSHFEDVKIDIFENFTYEEIAKKDYSSYDIIFRSPSVRPLGLKNESSVTKYFFDHCPCKIIGVTATKGKGTTCSFIKALLDAENEDAYLVGNIGVPAIEVLDRLKPTSVVVYEMSSFQLWDLEKSPSISVIGHLEPDHLNVHKDYDEYLSAKANIALNQTKNDFCIYYKNSTKATEIAQKSKAKKIPYPFNVSDDILKSIAIPGRHNQENAIAAVAAVACYKNISPDEYLREHAKTIKNGLNSFHGLPHRLEYLRELNGVKYYDDNFSTNPTSTKVAVEAFPNDQLVVIVGGRDKTNYADLPELYNILQSKNIQKIILMGESGKELAERYKGPNFVVVNSLNAAVTAARLEAEALQPAIVLMSPAAASFDMFENVYDRGAQFKNLIASLN